MANSLLPLVQYIHRIGTGSSGGDLSDSQLLERFVRQQDEEAFRALLLRHAPMVWNVCARVLHHPQEAEDAFQATFLVLVRKAGSIAQGERLANWLYGVAWRVANKARIQAAKRLARQKELADMPGKGPSAAPGWHELAAVLDEEVQRLPGKYREPIVLCYLEGLSNAEAARQLGCPEGTLSGWLTRGRERLRQRLRRRGMVVPAAAFASLMAENASSAAVPPALVASTLSTAHTVVVTGQLGLTSAAVAALTKGVLQEMVLIKPKIAAGILAATVVLAGSAWFGQHALAHKPPKSAAAQPKDPAAPTEKASHASKLDLTRESFTTFRDLVRPTDKEWRHLKVKWYTDIVAARKKAAQEDKPILAFYTGGAGYNDPLGVC